jgi:hypothetical protein
VNMPASVVCRQKGKQRVEREYAKRRERTGDGGWRRMSVYEEVTGEDTDRSSGDEADEARARESRQRGK